MAIHDPRIDDLLEKWEELRDAGTPVTATELCHDSPDLLPELKRRIDQILSLEPFIRGRHDSSERDPSLPERIGQFQVLSEIARGGMGIVYRCRQQSPPRDVAVKVMGLWRTAATALARFLREVQILGMLRHPGIAQIFEAGTTNLGLGEQPFFAMELVEGKSIDAFVREHALSPKDCLRLLIRVSEAIQHAHEHGVIHRDLKPANILVDEQGEPKVIDFGVARLVSSESEPLTSLHEDLVPLGSLPYMSPEQAAGDSKELDPRSDVYAIGVITYQILTGEMPYDCHTGPLARRIRVIEETVPKRLGAFNRAFCGDLETIVAKSLEKDRDLRYQSVAALKSDFERYLDNKPIAARPATIRYRFFRWCRRHPAIAGLAVSLIATLMAGVIGVFWQWQRAERNLEKANDHARVAEENVRKLQDMLVSIGWALDDAETWNDGDMQTFPRDHLMTFFDSMLKGHDGDTSPPALLAVVAFHTAKKAAADGNRELAISQYKDCLAHWRHLLDGDPHRMEYRRAHMASLYEFALLAGHDTDRVDALASFKDERLFDLLSPRDPKQRVLFHDYGYLLYQKARMDLKRRRQDEAMPLILASLRCHEALMVVWPETIQYREDSAALYRYLGETRLANGDLDGARHAAQKAILLLDELLKINSESPYYRWHVGVAWQIRGDILSRQGDFGQAKEAYQTAIWSLMVSHSKMPDHDEFRDSVARAHRDLGFAKLSVGDENGAVEALMFSQATWRPSTDRMSPETLLEFGTLCDETAKLCDRLGRTNDVLAASLNAAKGCEGIDARSRSTESELLRANNLDRAARCESQLGDQEKAKSHFVTAAEIFDGLARRFGNSSAFLQRATDCREKAAAAAKSLP